MPCSDPWIDARASYNMDEWEASTAQDLQTKLPQMYSLLTRGVTSMKLIAANGVLPGTGSTAGATATYNPSSQTCSSGCGLDGSGCGVLGNSSGSINHCIYEGSTFAPSPSSTTSPTRPSSTTSPTRSPIQAPTPTQSSCVDSPQPMRINGNIRTCTWVGRNDRRKNKRCAKTGVRDHCPLTCDGDCSADSKKRFKIGRKFRTCRWVARKNTVKRCQRSGVAETCRNTCS